MERNILSAIITNRGAFEYIRKVLRMEEFSTQGAIIFEKVKDFYDADDDAQTVDTTVLASVFDREYPKHADTFKGIVDTLEEVPSPANIAQEVLKIKRHRIRQELAGALLENKDSVITSLMDQLTELDAAEAYEEDENEDRETFSGLEIDNLLETFKKENLIQLYPKSLNEKVEGGVIRQTHICVFARPEVGKSLFCINLACGFAIQGLKVLYLCNEDPVRSIALRSVSRLSGKTRREIEADPRAAEQAATEKGYKNIVFSSEFSTADDVRRLTAKYAPDCVIVDQIRNLKGGGDGLTHSLETNSIRMREIAKRQNVLVVSVTQAGDSASNKLVLDQSDIDSSKTGLPATVDLLIGIGCNDAFESNGQRMASICKNKVTGNHDYFPFSINPSLSKASSI